MTKAAKINKHIYPRLILLLTVIVVLALSCHYSQNTRAATVTWDNDSGDNRWDTAANWSGDTVPEAGDAVIFDDTSNTPCFATSTDIVENLGSISMNSGYTNNFTIIATSSDEITLTGDLTVNYGAIIAQGDTLAIGTGEVGTPHGEGIVINADNVTVGENGTISADEQGFPKREGPGEGRDGSRGGGGYGGYGGTGDLAGSRGGSPYGSVSQPTSLGSGGAESGAGAGGGAIKLNVANSLTIEGIISVYGQQGPSHSGGSGGSIWLICDTLAGSGTIAADGGTRRNSSWGGGGGGRIALEWTMREFDGTISAQGKAGYSMSGKHGTIWVPADKWNELWNTTYHVNGDIALAPGTYNISELHLEDGVVLECQGDNDGAPANGSGVIINATNIDIPATAQISAQALGFAMNEGPGVAPRCTGGSHGGLGGESSRTPGSGPLPIYGSLSQPTSLGSGGGNFNSDHLGGFAGGAIKLNVSDTLTVNGDIMATGLRGLGWFEASGGSGGSIWLICDTLAGSGTLYASGAERGAGGRIAVYFSHYDSSLTTVSVAGNSTGEDGTIVWSPISGYTAESVIPVAQCVQSTNGDGLVTINFKIKDPGDWINGTYYNTNTGLYDFEYSVDGGSTWNAPTNADSSGCLAGSWPDNSSSYYTASSSYALATEHSFTWDTDHADITGLDGIDQDDIQIRFFTRNRLVQGAVTYYATSTEAATSTSFSVDNLQPNSLDNFVVSSVSTSTATLIWDSVTEDNFNHYEVWYGTTLSDVESRSTDTAIEWDNDDDSNLTSTSTNYTIIKNLDTSSNSYYFKIWAIDDYGNATSTDYTSSLSRLETTQVTSSSATLHWQTTNSANFDHYEIWYGTILANVLNRSAAEWDNDPNDANLGTASTNNTTITGLDPDSNTYYFKIWAVHSGGVEHTTILTSANNISSQNLAWVNDTGNGLWQDPRNWTSDILPGAGDNVTFDNTSQTNSVAASIQDDLASITIDTSYGANTITITPQAVAGQSNNLTLSGDFTANIGTTTIMADTSDTNGQGMIINANNITIGANAIIDASEQGFSSELGPGAGSTTANEGSGAGHAGAGGDSSSGASGGNSYGSSVEPISLGSGGGHSTYGSAGGGAIKLIATNNLILNGTITANSTTASSSGSSYGGGGSGGSIWLSSINFSGTGTISANGGNGASSNGGGGSGGRIVYIYTTKTFTGSATVSGGTGNEAGSTGTIRGGALTGNLVGSPYDTTAAANTIAGFNWTEDVSLPATTTVTMYLRASSSEALLLASDWIEIASSTSAGYLTSTCSKDGSGQATCDIDAIPASLKDGTGDRWFQYKVALTSEDLSSEPTISDIEITYVVNAPPDFSSNATASHGSDGLVTISYAVRDVDTTSGSITPDEITPSFQYSLNNGASWTNITSGLSSGATSTLAVGEVSYASSTVTWNAKTQIDGQYSTTTMIKVIADDSEAANNTASTTSAAFTLDTTDPAGASVIVMASTTPATINLSVTDDSSLEIKISLNDDLAGASWESYNSTSTISLAVDPDTVYVQYKDAYNNTTSIVNAITPDSPGSMMVQDTSNMTTTPEEYRLFIAWEVVDDPIPGFNHYTVLRSEDNITFTPLAYITNRSTNYYGDSSASFDTILYYKVATQDGDENVSYLSSAVNGKANGIQDAGEGGGGSESTPPIITNVATSSVYTSQATITWDTDELANSTVGYSATAGNFTNEVGVASMVNNASGVGVHEVILTGLTPNTTYYFQVQSIDPTGNIATSTSGTDGYMVTTLPGPVISSVSASAVENTSATITWNTDIASDSTVTYSVNTDLSAPIQITGLGSSVTEHSISLTGLTQGTKYYYYVESGVARDDNSGNYYNFITTSDTTGPVLSNIRAESITDTTTVIQWSTNEAATSKVDYGTISGSYTTSSSTSSYDFNHAVNLADLANSTTHYYIVVSTDQSSNTSTSTEYSFTTLEQLTEESQVEEREEAAESRGYDSAPGGGGILIIDKTDSVAPLISDIKILDIRSDSATVSWTTDEQADSFVEYGETISYGNTFGQRDNTTNHSVILENLLFETYYNFRVTSADEQGNLAQSTNNTFTTLSLTKEIEQELGLGEVEGVSESEGKTTAEILRTAADKAMEIFNRLASQVSIGILESTISSQVNSLQQLAQVIPAPIMSGEPRVTVTANTATIFWQTDKEANSLVALAPEGRFDSASTDPYVQVVGDSEIQATIHQVTIYDLEPVTTYHYQLRNKAQIGPVARSRDFTFITLRETITIENYSVQKISEEEAIFEWITNTEADTELIYIPYRNNLLSVDERRTKITETVALIHEVKVDDFEAGTVYQIELTSTDALDNTANQIIPSFFTSETDLPPKIYQVQTSSALSLGRQTQTQTKVQTIIAWQTNESATTRLYYEEGVVTKDKELAGATKIDTNYTKKHIVVITKFNPDTVYTFRVESIDSGGNVTLSELFTVLTPKQKESVLQIITSNLEQTFGWIKKIGFGEE